MRMRSSQHRASIGRGTDRLARQLPSTPVRYIAKENPFSIIDARERERGRGRENEIG